VLDPAVFAAVAVVLGGVAAVTARDGRMVVLGLMVAGVASALVASPLPGSLELAARILGAILAAYLLWAAAGSGSINSVGSAIGPGAEGAVAAVAFVIGFAIRPVDPLAGPAEAQAAGMALIALAIVPLAGRDVFRLGVGVTLLTLGSSMMVEAWAGSTPPLEQLAMAALLVGIAGATSLLIPGLPLIASEGFADDLVRDDSPVEVAEMQPDAAPRSRKAAASRRPAEFTPAVQAVMRPEAPKVADRPARSIEPENSPTPMTADPIDPDDWLAWGSPEPLPTPSSARRARRAPAPPTDQTGTPAPKKPTRSRPNLHGKP
jgi:hypothetical protein